MDSSERYEVLKVLQENEAGRVSLVWHKELKCRRIIKEMNRFHEGGVSLRSEIEIMQKLKASFFPRVYDSYETEDKIVLVEEYVEGEDLGVYFRRVKSISPAELLKFSLELCRIIAFLHSPEVQVLHLDIKPGNIVISDNSMKLVDFGSAICRGRELTVRSGTPHFAAPELMMNGSLSDETDIYSMGKTFEFMRMYAGEIPKGYDRIISRCLRKGKSYKSAEEVAKELEKIKSHRVIPSGDNLMAVVGIPSGEHATAFALELAIAGGRKRKTVLLDCNPLRNLEKMEESQNKPSRSTGFSYLYKGILVGKRIESPDVRGWRGRGYENIVCDLGSDYTSVGALPYKKVFLTGSLTPWSREKWAEAVNYLKDRTEVYLVLTEKYDSVHIPDIKHSRIIALNKGLTGRQVTRCIQ